MAGRLRDRVPVTETDVSSTFVTILELIHKQPELRFGRESTSFNNRVGGKVVVGGHDGPQMSNLQWDGTVHGEDLSMI